MRIMCSRLSSLLRNESGASVIECGFVAALGALALALVLGALTIVSVFVSAAEHLATLSVVVR